MKLKAWAAVQPRVPGCPDNIFIPHNVMDNIMHLFTKKEVLIGEQSGNGKTQSIWTV